MRRRGRREPAAAILALPVVLDPRRPTWGSRTDRARLRSRPSLGGAFVKEPEMRSRKPCIRPTAFAVRRHRHVLLAGVAALTGWAFAVPAVAAGFQINEQSVRGLGRAFSGETALGGDASSLWYNPALATDFQSPIATVGVSGFFPKGRLRNRGSTIAGPGTLGQPVPLSGPDARDELDAAAIPDASVIVPVSPDVSLGLNLNAPFGLVSDYPQDYFGRYDSTHTALRTVNVQGSVAWRVSPQWSIAGGIDAQRASATLDNALPNLAPGAPDGFLRVKGSDWAWGWNIGAAWRATDRLRLGASYRSSISHDLKGSIDILGLAGPLAAQNGQRTASAGLRTPAMASVGAAYTLNPQWTLTAQGNWNQWSRFKEIRVVSPGAAPLVSPQNYRDSVSIAVGAERKIRPDWTARAGVMAETTPTQAAYRDTRTPDAKRLWLTLGATWVVSPRLSVDMGLAYVRLNNATLNRQDIIYASSPAATTSSIRAIASGHAVVAGVGGSWRF
jgi:long-chain fatty acid transport protein